MTIVLINPTLKEFGISALTGVTTIYISLRLGYTAKAGLENYKKISETYKEIQDAAAISGDTTEQEEFESELG